MQIKLNGEKTEVPDGLTVEGLLAKLEIPSEKTAVEINGEFLDQKNFAERTLDHDDKVEVVRFVGGG